MDDRELTDTQRIWLTHVEACAAAGCSMKAYAEEHGLDLQSFYLWKGRLKKLGLVAGPPDQPTPRLQALPQTRRPENRCTRIELANGISIEAPDDIDGDALCALLRAAIGLPLS
jgi:hypothetical protein